MSCSSRPTVTWQVVEKLQEKDPWGDGVHLVLVVKRAGRTARKTVSGATWYAVQVGQDVELPA